METQLLFLNIIISTGLVCFVVLLALKTIIYNNEIKLTQLEVKKKAIEAELDKKKIELEKSKTDLENTRLLKEYAEYTKNNAKEISEGYQSKIEQTFKEIEGK